MDDKDKDVRNKNGQFVAGNMYTFKKGKSGNPKGRPPKSAVLKELDEKLGAVPRETLFKILDQAINNTKHFKARAPISKAIEQMGVHDIIKISTYLDEQSNGKAKTTAEVEGAVIMLSRLADEL